MSKALIILFLLQCWSVGNYATDIIFQSRSATALNSVYLYPDSTFAQQYSVFYEEGALFEIVGESELEHEDVNEQQKFKWYQVKTPDQRIGWIFGEGLAVALDDDVVEETLRVYHKRNIRLSSGFENAVMWLASIEGRDNLHQQDFMNPPYQELYLVITNEREKSVHLNLSSLNSNYQTLLRNLRLYDTTGDEIPEIIVQTTSQGGEGKMEERRIEIYGLQAGVLTQLLDERMTLTYADDQPSPALFKQVEVDQQLIRVAYIDYLPCKAYRLGDYDPQKPDRERCLEYVTYMYQWDERGKRFNTLYDESRSPLQANIRVDGVVLREQPTITGKKMGTLAKGESVRVIKHFERKLLENNQLKIVPYLYVQLSDHTLGYVLAEDVDFKEIEHAAVLSSYYQVQPKDKVDWKTTATFLRFIPDNRDYFSGK